LINIISTLCKTLHRGWRKGGNTKFSLLKFFCIIWLNTFYINPTPLYIPLLISPFLLITPIITAKVIMQGKCTHLFYSSVLSLGGNVNTRKMSKPGIGSIFHKKKQCNILVIGNYYVNYQKYQNLMLLTCSDIKRPLMHLFFTNSVQRELVPICAQLKLTSLTL